MSLHRITHRSSSNLILDESFQQRQWLKKRGKSNRLLFSDEMVRKLQNYFVSLDQDGSNSISSNQLQDPLLLFGLCKNRVEVKEIFKSIDFDGSGQLEFRQFLQVFRRVKAEKLQKRPCRKTYQSKKYEQFTSTLLGMQNKLQSGMSFRMGMSIYRRKNLLNAITATDMKTKLQGREIMSKFQQQVKSNPETRGRLLVQKEVKESVLPDLPTIYSSRRRLKTIN